MAKNDKVMAASVSNPPCAEEEIKSMRTEEAEKMGNNVASSVC